MKERSPELQALDAKYARLREQRTAAGQLPALSVRSPEEVAGILERFVDLSTEVALTYQPSGYLTR